MKKADVLIGLNQGIYRIRVEGRATFECAPPVRNLAKNIAMEQTLDKICVNLKACTFMDSTFMGVLAMVGLEARKRHVPVEILEASRENLALLDGLGLKKLFHFGKIQNDINIGPIRERKDDVKDSKLQQAKMIHDAHKTLMEVDDGNVPKFKTVVDFAKKDVDRLKEEDES